MKTTNNNKQDTTQVSDINSKDDDDSINEDLRIISKNQCSSQTQKHQVTSWKRLFQEDARKSAYLIFFYATLMEG